MIFIAEVTNSFEFLDLVFPLVFMLTIYKICQWNRLGVKVNGRTCNGLELLIDEAGETLT